MRISKIKQRPLRIAPSRKRDVRTQFGALCWRKHRGEVQLLLVTSRGSGRWVMPKGWPMDGETPANTAATEAWEEAGVEGKVLPVCLGIYSYSKGIAEGDTLPCVVAVFPVKVKRTASNWPEKPDRKRRWFSLKKASSLVAEPELKRIMRDFDPALLTG